MILALRGKSKRSKRSRKRSNNATEAEALCDRSRELVEEGELGLLDDPRVLHARAAVVLDAGGLVLLEVGVLDPA